MWIKGYTQQVWRAARIIAVRQRGSRPTCLSASGTSGRGFVEWWECCCQPPLLPPQPALCWKETLASVRFFSQQVNKWAGVCLYVTSIYGIYMRRNIFFFFFFEPNHIHCNRLPWKFNARPFRISTPQKAKFICLVGKALARSGCLQTEQTCHHQRLNNTGCLKPVLNSFPMCFLLFALAVCAEKRLDPKYLYRCCSIFLNLSASRSFITELNVLYLPRGETHSND